MRTPFKLSPAPESRPAIHLEEPHPPAEAAAPQPVGAPQIEMFGLAAPVPPAQQPLKGDQHIRFDLVDEDADPAAIVAVSPEIARGLQGEIEEFRKDPARVRTRG